MGESCAGGSDSRGWDRNLNTTEIYDPRTGKFTAASPMNDKRFKLPDEAVPLTSGRLLFAGGSKEAEIFNPGDGKFVAAAGQMDERWHYVSETRLRIAAFCWRAGTPIAINPRPRPGPTVPRALPGKWLILARMAEISHPNPCNFSPASAFK
jgi:hypothetical protein